MEQIDFENYRILFRHSMKHPTEFYGKPETTSQSASETNLIEIRRRNSQKICILERLRASQLSPNEPIESETPETQFFKVVYCLFISTTSVVRPVHFKNSQNSIALALALWSRLSSKIMEIHCFIKWKSKFRGIVRWKENLIRIQWRNLSKIRTIGGSCIPSFDLASRFSLKFQKTCFKLYSSDQASFHNIDFQVQAFQKLLKTPIGYIASMMTELQSHIASNILLNFTRNAPKYVVHCVEWKRNLRQIRILVKFNVLNFPVMSWSAR